MMDDAIRIIEDEHEAAIQIILEITLISLSDTYCCVWILNDA